MQDVVEESVQQLIKATATTNIGGSRIQISSSSTSAHDASGGLGRGWGWGTSVDRTHRLVGYAPPVTTTPWCFPGQHCQSVISFAVHASLHSHVLFHPVHHTCRQTHAHRYKSSARGVTHHTRCCLGGAAGGPQQQHTRRSEGWGWQWVDQEGRARVCRRAEGGE